MNFKGAGKATKPIISCNLHTHNCWEFIYQINNHTIATVGNTSIPMEAGDIIVIPPDTPHKTESDVYFSDMHIKLDGCTLGDSAFVVKDVDGPLGRLFEVILSIHNERSEISDVISEKITEIILIYVKKMSFEQQEPVAVSDFKRLLRDNVDNVDFKLTESMESMGYDTDYFRRIFKKHTLVTPLAYLNRLRMERAKELLSLEDSLSVEEIAHSCGYRDSFYFSTSFKRQVGISPLAFRRKNK